MSITPAPLFSASLPSDRPIAVSVVTPMFNEEGGAAALVREIAAAMAGTDFEIVVVDDASSDGTREALSALRAEVPELRILVHGNNAGQSRALRTGILGARGAIIATLDGDGQNVPGDIPALYAQLRRNDAPALLALVGGERQDRQDSQAKKSASRAANMIRRKLLRDDTKDTGCGLKVFYRDAFLRLPYFDHVHRYIPALMVREGFRCEFSPVSHRARTHGRSKYTNLGRAGVAFRDLVGVTWLIARSRNPLNVDEI